MKTTETIDQVLKQKAFNKILPFPRSRRSARPWR